MKKGTVILVDSTSSSLARAIKDAGFSAGCLFTWRDKMFGGPYELCSPEFDFCVDAREESSLEEIEKKLRQAVPNIVGIIPDKEPTEETACLLAERFGLIHNDPELVSIRRDKAKVKELAQAAGLRVPKFKACNSSKDILKFIEATGFPIIIKTPQGASGVNVFKCHDEKSLLRKHDDIMQNLDRWGEKNSYSVLEEYIGGTEYQVNTFSDGKRVRVADIDLTEKIDTSFGANLYYNEWILSPHDSGVNAIVKYIEKVVEAVGIKYGPGHVEIKVDEKGPALIEAHARFAGGEEEEVIHAHSNFDPFRAAVEVFTQGTATIPDPIEISSYIACAACPSEVQCRRGILLGLDQIRSLPSYYAESLRVNPNPGPIKPTIDFQTLPLYVWLANKDKEQLIKDRDAVHRLFKIQCL